MGGMRMKYPNLFAQLGRSEAEIDAKLAAAFRAIFEDPEERFYFEIGADKGYLLDTGNVDARTEGISYGMMMAVQMDRKDLFDRLWRFAWDFMLLREGPHAGYFAWSVAPDGTTPRDPPRTARNTSPWRCCSPRPAGARGSRRWTTPPRPAPYCATASTSRRWPRAGAPCGTRPAA